LTSRPNPIKAELRSKTYELFEVALRWAGISTSHRDKFVDRGDGILALIHPVDQVPKALLLNRAVPVLSRLLADYNASLPRFGHSDRQLRIRVVMHAGEVHYDANGCFGEALDVAFRLLDAVRVKRALRETADPLILVISGDIYNWSCATVTTASTSRPSTRWCALTSPGSASRAGSIFPSRSRSTT
jgi:hypothetical protein